MNIASAIGPRNQPNLKNKKKTPNEFFFILRCINIILLLFIQPLNNIDKKLGISREQVLH